MNAYNKRMQLEEHKKGQHAMNEKAGNLGAFYHFQNLFDSKV